MSVSFGVAARLSNGLEILIKESNGSARLDVGDQSIVGLSREHLQCLAELIHRLNLMRGEYAQQK